MDRIASEIMKIAHLLIAADALRQSPSWFRSWVSGWSGLNVEYGPSNKTDGFVYSLFVPKGSSKRQVSREFENQDDLFSWVRQNMNKMDGFVYSLFVPKGSSKRQVSREFENQDDLFSWVRQNMNKVDRKLDNMGMLKLAKVGAGFFVDGDVQNG